MEEVTQTQNTASDIQTDSPAVDYAFDRSEFWRTIPAWRDIDAETFGDFRWQQQNSITSVPGIQEVLQGLATPPMIADIEDGLLKTPMNVRLTPYIFSRIDWRKVENDPVRRQFLPLGSQFIPDHPHAMDDSLDEDGHKATPYLTHRYPDKALFLPLTLCPVYCTFCTRSRVVGGSTAVKSKSTYGAKASEWDETFEYIRNNPQLEDIVISGGDALLLRPSQIHQIGTTLLEIPTIRRIRFATKGIAIMPMKFTSDTEWVEALSDVCRMGRDRMKEVALHTHFNTDREITAWTSRAMKALSETGVRVRNQSVLISGVNDSFDCLHRTSRKLSSQLIQPYYIYLHDMVPGCEHLRTTVRTAEHLSRRLQGSIAGFNTPRVVCDAPGGGGKREISSYTLYDQEIGVSAWTSPTAKPGEIFYYYDPIHQLSNEGQALWANEPEINRRLAKFKAESTAKAEATRV